MSGCSRRGRQLASVRWTRWGALAVFPIVFVFVPSLAHLPARLLAGCPRWVALGGLLELASIGGFVGSFAAVFGARMPRRRALVAALRALGASTVLPAGGLVGPAIGVRSADRDRAPLGQLVRSTIALTVLTTAPSVAALALFGVGLWLGLPGGPQCPLLTLPVAGAAVALLALTCLLGRRSERGIQSPRRVLRFVRWITGSAQMLRQGAAEAGLLVASRKWKLVGVAVAYYAFDNAVLWAAFRAYDSSPPLGVVAMGYLVGSLAAAVPVPAGLGALEGGLIGALVLYGAPVAPAASAVLLYRGISLGLPVIVSAPAWAADWRDCGGSVSARRADALAQTVIPAAASPTDEDARGCLSPGFPLPTNSGST